MENSEKKQNVNTMYRVGRVLMYSGLFLLGFIISTAEAPQTMAVAIICSILLLIGRGLEEKATQSKHRKEIADLERLANKIAVEDARTMRAMREPYEWRGKAIAASLTKLKLASEQPVVDIEQLKLLTAQAQEALYRISPPESV